MFLHGLITGIFIGQCVMSSDQNYECAMFLRQEQAAKLITHDGKVAV